MASGKPPGKFLKRFFLARKDWSFSNTPDLRAACHSSCHSDISPPCFKMSPLL